MAKTIGSFDLASLKNLRDDVTQYFWFESDSSSAWGSGAHVTLYPESQFTNPSHANYMKGQNIIMNTDGFSIRNGGLPMMVLDNNSLDFNAVDTSLGTYVTMATFGLNGVQIGADSTAYALINADEFSARNADGVKFFDANFNGGSISVPTFIDSTIYKTVSVSGTRYTIPFTINIPNNIPVGTTLTSEKPVLGNNYPPLCSLTYKSGTQITTVVSEIGKLKGSYSSLLKRNSIWYSEQISFTIGTSKTIIAESDGAVSFQYGNSEIGVVYTLNYDASVNKLFGEIIIISLTTANTGLDVIITNRYKYNAVTTAPSFTFGQRTAENSNGNFSTIIGNELIAKQDYQTVIGLFNNNKTNTLFEIGNGTANNMRSNALTVDLDGNVEAKGEFITRQTTLNLGVYIASGILTSNAGLLTFSIPTGRVFPSGTTISKITFDILARASSANGTGYYIIESTTTGSDVASFDSSTSKTFHNANDTTKTITSAMWTKELYGGTNIYIAFSGGNDFFSGTTTIRNYINNNAAVIYLSNIVVTLSIPSA